MGKTASRLYRSTRAVAKPTQPAAANAARAQKRLVQEIPDEELFGQHKGLHVNLQSVYVQSESTIKKTEQVYGSDIKEGGISSDDLLKIFYYRRSGGDMLKWMPEKIATDYKISKTDAENLLHYFNNFVISGKISELQAIAENPDK